MADRYVRMGSPIVERHYRHTSRPRVIVVSDSILKYCNLFPFAHLVPFRGADLSDVIFKERRSRIAEWRDYDLVFLHIGTNDIANYQARLVHNRTKTLIRLIQASNPYIQIIISSILPRPCDIDNHYITNSIIQTNKVLKIWAKHEKGVHFWGSFHSFVRKGTIRYDNWMWARDELHLNYQGTERMEDLIKALIGQYYKGRVPFEAE